MFVAVSRELDTLTNLGCPISGHSGIDLMIRYSSYGSTNYRTPHERTSLDPLAAEYRKLQELRERVREAEAAAAKRLKSRGERKHPSSTRRISKVHGGSSS